VHPRFRAVRRCGDTATPRGRSRCKGPPAGADADVVRTRATSRRPRARRIDKAGAALSRAHQIIPATFPPSHLQSALSRLVLGALSDSGRAPTQELVVSGVLTPLKLNHNMNLSRLQIFRWSCNILYLDLGTPNLHPKAVAFQGPLSSPAARTAADSNRAGPKLARSRQPLPIRHGVQHSTGTGCQAL
jgi:hypothetical protein